MGYILSFRPGAPNPFDAPDDDATALCVTGDCLETELARGAVVVTEFGTFDPSAAQPSQSSVSRFRPERRRRRIENGEDEQC